MTANYPHPEERNVLDLLRLDGKIALVSGGAGAYGRQISNALAEAGAHVIIASRHLDQCQQAADEITAWGFSASAAPLDMADEASIRALHDHIMAQHGRLDILFNNSVSRRNRPFNQQTAEDWAETLKVNATGLFLCCQILGGILSAQGSGSIVNIASIYGMVGPDFRIYEGTAMSNPADYSFSKGGMINFTRYLATHFAPYNVRVNCLSPGGYSPDPHRAENPFTAAYRRRTPLGRFAGPNDIKGAAVFFASDASAYITGQNLAVDGGWTAW